jgi:hypothetical protein
MGAGQIERDTHRRNGMTDKPIDFDSAAKEALAAAEALKRAAERLQEAMAVLQAVAAIEAAK